MTKDIMEGISPLPWRIEIANDRVWVGTQHSSSQTKVGNVIFGIPYGEDYTDWHNTRVNADVAYIVHAANLYPELVDALERLTMMAEGVPLKALDTVIWTQDARAILAKCKAGSE